MGRKPTHDMSRTKIYKAWQQMKVRCYSSNHPSYAQHGARGIEVCERWHVFENFFEDMGPRPDGMSLDRIDNNGNYEPGNCRWATQREQMNNRRPTIWISHMGMDRPMKEWAEITGTAYGALMSRYRRGWSHEDIICGRK